MAFIEWIIDKESAETVRDDLADILAPQLRMKFEDVSRKKRAVQQAKQKALNHHNQIRKKVDNFYDLFSFGSELLQLIAVLLIAIPFITMIAIIIAILGVYARLMRKEVAQRKKLIEWMSYEDHSPDNFRSLYRTAWNTALGHTLFLAAMFVVVTASIYFPGFYSRLKSALGPIFKRYISKGEFDIKYALHQATDTE